ncbi:hypothetical protein ACNART_07905 [Proteus sp. LHD240705]|uniref:hypothetical protein n=1 Tax=Proteus sp. LHD240705 TaxID=3400183 RepID=UPI003A4E560A
MGDNNKKRKNILHWKNVGSIIEVLITAIYGIMVYYSTIAIQYLYENKYIGYKIQITLIILVISLLLLFRKIASEALNMESSYNKERIEHNKTKNSLQKKIDIIHAIYSGMNNTFITSKNDEELIENLRSIAKTINKDKDICNVNTVLIDENDDNEKSRKDYLSLFENK